MSASEWSELIRAVTLMISALGTIFGGLISVQIFNQRLELASLRTQVKTLQTANDTLVTKVTELNGVINEYTTRLNNALDNLNVRNTELVDVHKDLAKGVEALGNASERIEKLREGLEKDGSRAALDAVLETDNQDKKEQESK